MKMLRSKLVEIKEREHLEKIEDIKGDQKDIGWGNQIRSLCVYALYVSKQTTALDLKMAICSAVDGRGTWMGLSMPT